MWKFTDFHIKLSVRFTNSATHFTLDQIKNYFYFVNLGLLCFRVEAYPRFAHWLTTQASLQPASKQVASQSGPPFPSRVIISRFLNQHSNIESTNQVFMIVTSTSTVHGIIHKLYPSKLTQGIRIYRSRCRQQPQFKFCMYKSCLQSYRNYHSEGNWERE